MNTAYVAPFVDLQSDDNVEDAVVWYVVAIFVLLALGATILLGAMAWCFIHAKHSLYAVVSLNPWTFKVGCN
ncbi:hypothetical protein [Caenibacillus caldisaponilyticus]|uniref:hypothetical protein n=1 Tax=Caenibacillus caldisaponilyticus TaxID=1674942 RepID=UPI0009886FCF|nr:hypothetical protein [Caenibacillus caldisaponilyticus]